MGTKGGASKQSWAPAGRSEDGGAARVGGEDGLLKRTSCHLLPLPVGRVLAPRQDAARGTVLAVDGGPWVTGRGGLAKRASTCAPLGTGPHAGRPLEGSPPARPHTWGVAIEHAAPERREGRTQRRHPLDAFVAVRGSSSGAPKQNTQEGKPGRGPSRRKASAPPLKRWERPELHITAAVHVAGFIQFRRRQRHARHRRRGTRAGTRAQRPQPRPSVSNARNLLSANVPRPLWPRGARGA